MGTESQVTLSLGGLYVSLAGRPWMPLSLLQLYSGEGGVEVGWRSVWSDSCNGGSKAVRIQMDCPGLGYMRPGGRILAKEKQQAQYWEVGIVKPSLPLIQIRCRQPNSILPSSH